MTESRIEMWRLKNLQQGENIREHSCLATVQRSERAGLEYTGKELGMRRQIDYLDKGIGKGIAKRNSMKNYYSQGSQNAARLPPLSRDK